MLPARLGTRSGMAIRLLGCAVPVNQDTFDAMNTAAGLPSFRLEDYFSFQLHALRGDIPYSFAPYLRLGPPEATLHETYTILAR